MILEEIAFARSGDKGKDANIALFARSQKDYDWMVKEITAERVGEYFSVEVVRFELPKLNGFNFVLYDILGKGGSGSLKADNQGKALAQALLLMPIGEKKGSRYDKVY